MKEKARLLYIYLQVGLIYSKMESQRKAERQGASPGSKTGHLGGDGKQRKPVGGTEVPVLLEGRLCVCLMEGWNPESIQNRGSARGILELNPEHSWADHSVPVLSGESPEPLCPQCCPQRQRGKVSGVTAR